MNAVEIATTLNNEPHHNLCNSNRGLDCDCFKSSKREYILASALARKDEALRTADSLLRESYTRLMVSEGDARYIDNNVELALRIDAALTEGTAEDDRIDIVKRFQ